MRTAPLCVAAIVLLCAPAHAEDLEPTLQADDTAAFGGFVPLVDSPAMPASVIKTYGLYDSARESTALVIDAQGRLTSRLQLQAAARYDDGELSSLGAVQVALLQGLHHGLDLQLSAGWAEQGINRVPAAFAELGAGRYHAGSYLFATARFDLGLQQGERGLAFGIGNMRQLAPATYVGALGRVELDVERDAIEPMNESSWSLQLGPALTYIVDRFAVTASGGLAADTPRMQSRTLGAFGSVGIGAAF